MSRVLLLRNPRNNPTPTLRPSTRPYASAINTPNTNTTPPTSTFSNSPPPTRPRRFSPIDKSKSRIGLEHFLQRTRALHLYREITRTLNKVPPSATKDGLRDFARQGFEQHKDVTDIIHIRYLISTGRTEFETMRRYVEEQVR